MQAANGIDPKQAKLIDKEKQMQTFEVVALEWWKAQEHTWKEEHARRVKYWLTTHWMGFVMGRMSYPIKRKA